MEEYIKSLYIKIKNNVVMLALIPSLLGGIWQLVKLAEISPNMIRFFSISQLISDGLLILIFVFIPFVTIMPLLFSIHPYNHDIFIQKTPYDKFFRRLMYPLCIVLSILYVIDNIKLNSIKELVHFLAGLYFFYMLIIVFSQVFFKITFGKYFLIIIIYLINLGTSFYTFYKIDSNDKNIVNFKNLILKIKHEDIHFKNPKILYFNDKYIFIEVLKNNKKEIIIEKFDSIFE